MTNRERVAAVLDGRRVDRLPVVEWATWWNLTIERWTSEGIPNLTGSDKLETYFGLDPLHQIWLFNQNENCPQPASHGAGIICGEADYEALLENLYTDDLIQLAVKQALQWKEGHERGDFAVWLTLDGFFWFPRKLLGIEEHLYAFYDQPELIQRINRDITAYYLRCLEKLLPVLRPEFMTFAEDMSYNRGPMISKELFEEFMQPYYAQLIPLLKSAGVKILIDTDGDVEPLIPWFQQAGIEGVLPLERQAGVDVNRIRSHYPDWLMLGGFDKTIMHLGEEAMRTEFERLLPAMKSGRYIPSVDHQTPPDVSLAQYQTYVALLQEYAEKAAK